jgi:hypothetical protein
MDFLQGSQTYPLEAALEVAQQRGLIDEQVNLHPLSVFVCVGGGDWYYEGVIPTGDSTRGGTSAGID